MIESDKEMRCRKCNSDSMDYTKHINYGPKMGNVYHFKAHCLACGKSYHVSRTSQVFDKVKDKNWIKSSSKIMQERQISLL